MSAIGTPAPRSSSRSRLQVEMRGFTAKAGITLLAISIVSIFLMPLGYMVATAFKDRTQLTTPGAPL
jgi:ABC-type glycerol-3-phosphate transport system permease component